MITLKGRTETKIEDFDFSENVLIGTKILHEWTILYKNKENKDWFGLIISETRSNEKIIDFEVNSLTKRIPIHALKEIAEFCETLK